MKKQRRASVGGDKPRHGERRRVVESARSARNFGQSELLIAAALAVATLAVYGQVTSHQFISLDDDLYIRDNPMVIGGLTLKGIAWAFTTFHAANWHPLTWLSHMGDSQVFGLNAGGHLFLSALIQSRTRFSDGGAARRERCAFFHSATSETELHGRSGQLKAGAEAD